MARSIWLHRGRVTNRSNGTIRSSDAAGEVIAEFIEKQLTSAQVKRDKLEARGIAVITTSGVLVTLQLAFAALLPKDRKAPPTAASIFIGISLICFVGAAIFGILVNMPKRWSEADSTKLGVHLEDPFWAFPALAAKRKVAKVRLEILQKTEVGLAHKARRLIVAFAAELAGIASLTVAAILILASY